jgi:PD-(D/E)XK endonuclease
VTDAPVWSPTGVNPLVNRKRKGDLAELKVATDLIERGYQVAIPFGEDWDFDLVLWRARRFERIQVKYAASRDGVIPVRCRSHSLTNGKVRRTKHYTADLIDWLAVYDRNTDRCFYVQASELRVGMSVLHLRLTPPRNNQAIGVRYADDYRDLDEQGRSRATVEPAGFEPATSRMQTGRSPS